MNNAVHVCVCVCVCVCECACVHQSSSKAAVNLPGLNEKQVVGPKHMLLALKKHRIQHNSRHVANAALNIA